MKKRNKMSEEYFKKHIMPTQASAGPWGSGEGFFVWYMVKVDWCTISEYDQFIIKINSSDPTWKQLSVPRDAHLSEQELEPILDREAFSSSITPIVPLLKLKFNSRVEAVKALQKIAKTDKIGFERFAYYVPGKLPRENGHPFLIGWGEIDKSKNECIWGYIDLVTGEGYARKDVCVIYN